MVGLLVVVFVPLLLSFLSMPGLYRFLRVAPVFRLHCPAHHPRRKRESNAARPILRARAQPRQARSATGNNA